MAEIIIAFVAVDWIWGIIIGLVIVFAMIGFIEVIFTPRKGRE